MAKRPSVDSQDIVCGFAEVEAPDLERLGMAGMPFGPRVMLGPFSPSRLTHGEAEDLTEPERHDRQVVPGHSQCRRPNDESEGRRNTASS